MAKERQNDFLSKANVGNDNNEPKNTQPNATPQENTKKEDDREKRLLEIIEKQNQLLEENKKIVKGLEEKITKVETSQKFSTIGQNFVMNAEKVPFGEQINPTDKDDLLAEPITYYMRGRAFYLPAYFKNSIEIKSPTNTVLHFEYAAADRQISGREQNILHYCKYTCYLKSVQKFIEESPYYSSSFRVIWKTIDDAKNQDSGVALKIRQALDVLAKLSDKEINARIIRYGLDPNKFEDMDAIKGEIVNREIENIVKEEESAKANLKNKELFVSKEA